MNYFNFLSTPTYSLDISDTLSIIFFAIGGLGLFFYGLHVMSDSLKDLAGNKLKILVQKSTSNLFKGIVVGCIITLLIQSSSATTVIIVGLISAGLMNLKQAVGVLIGANIGTTITAFIIGLNLSNYALPIIFIGSVLCVFIARRKLNITGHTIFGFGILFLGLEFIGIGMRQVAEFDFFEKAIVFLSEYSILGVICGTVFTALVQSSSAFIGIVQKLFASGAIPIAAVIPIIFGSNIGTTTTALLASLSGSREAKQAAIFNFFFNLFGTVVLLIILNPFTKLFTIFEQNILGENNMFTIAFIHLFFNIITTLLFIPIVKYVLKLTMKLMPINNVPLPEISALLLNEELLETSPVLALESSRISIINMSKVALEMVSVAHQYLNTNDHALYDKCFVLEDNIDLYDHSIHDYLMQLHTDHLNTRETITHAIYLDTIRDLERIGDHSINLVEFFEDRYQNNITTSGEVLENLNYFFEKVITQINNSIIAFEEHDVNVAKEIIKLEDEIDNLERKYRRAQLTNLDTHNILSDIHYVDILSNLERISDHCCNIAENVIDPYYMKKND